MLRCTLNVMVPKEERKEKDIERSMLSLLLNGEATMEQIMEDTNREVQRHGVSNDTNFGWRF